MRFSVRHRTTFEYEDLVSVSHHLLHLTPRDHPRQRCVQSTIVIRPEPTLNCEGQDYFGNPVRHLMISEPHRKLIVEADSLVDVTAESSAGQAAAGPAWEDIVRMLEVPAGTALEAYEFVFDSPYVACDEATRAFALESFLPGRPVLEACGDLTRRIYEQFEYRGGVSDVSTPVAQVLAQRQGVCQDFAHLQIACLRSLGLPARYVSGYLLTRPPEGTPKLVGADASHAWLAIWAAESGWVDFDPTNNQRPGKEHITVGWGRDYGDVSPINGFILGGGAHTIDVAVDVNGLAD